MRNTFIFILFSVLLGFKSYAQAPTANFSSNVTSGCSPLVVSFTDQSSGGPTGWDWDLGNGTLSTKQNPTATYFTPGTYNIKLTAKNGSGSSTKTGVIIVYDSPEPDFTLDKQSGCFPVQVHFTDQSTAVGGNSNVTWLWDFGNGVQSSSQNPTAVYRSAGTFSVFLKVTNDKGCSKSITKSGLVNVSQGVSVDFANNPVPAVCNPPYIVPFGNRTTGPGNLTYSWNFGDGNTSTLPDPTNAYTKSGNYLVTLIVTSDMGCSDTVRRTNAVTIPQTKTDFTVTDSICLNKPVAFTNISQPEPENSVWQFSDGTTINDIDAIKAFTVPGTYTVKLTNNFVVCSGDITKTIVVADQPKPAFDAPVHTACKPSLTVQFSNSSQNAATYLWDFGDGTTSTATNPSHTYTSAGQYTVKLFAFNKNGCADSLVQNNFVKIKPPDIKFDNLPTGGCVPYIVAPTATIESISNISSYKWDFGDGTTQTGPTPSHQYNAVGNYKVSLDITTSDGCSVSYSLNNAVRIGDKPSPAFDANPKNICSDTKVNFINQSNPIGASFIWKFGDGGTSNLVNPSYNYTDTGWFQITLIEDNNGCIDSISSPKQYIHRTPPVSRFSLVPDCSNQYRYNFKDESLFDAGSVATRTWAWVLPDGSKYNTQTPPAYTFPGPGTYPISLTTSDGVPGGCSHTLVQNVVIADKTPSYITFDKSGDCKPVYSSFQALSTNQGEIVDYTWEIEGKTLSFPTPYIGYIFNTSGNIDVKLTTKDIYGCTYTSTKPLHIGGPNAAFEGINAQGCIGLTATFKDLTQTDGISKIVDWKWSFGDRTPTVDNANGNPVTHSYVKKGTYTPKLVVKDAAGCVDSVSLTNYVKVSVLAAGFNFTQQACLGSSISFVNQSQGNVTSSVWTFGDNAPPVTDAQGQYIYKDTGLYTVKLVVEDDFGCRDSIQKDKAIQISKPVAAFSVNDSISFCPPFEVQFTNRSTFIGGSVWTFYNTSTSTEVNPKLVLNSPGTYPIKLNVVSPDGTCADSAFTNIRIYRPEDAQLSYDPIQVCIPGAVNLSAFSNYASAKFFWDFGDGNILDTSVNNVTHTYTDFGTFTPKIILTESSGCVLPIAGTQPIKVKGAIVNFKLDKLFFCDSGLVTIKDSTISNEAITNYNWDFGDGTISNNPLPVHQFVAPGFYTVSLNVKTQSGCTDTMTYTTPVKIVQSPLISIAGDSVICVNDLLRSSGVMERPDTSQVQWAWQFPNGNQAVKQLPAPQRYPKAGNFAITAVAVNSSGCADTAVKNILVHPLPTVTLPSTLTMQAGYPISIPATYTNNVVNYSWTPDTSLSCSTCPQPIVNAKFDTKYTVTFTDSNGCKNTGEVQVIIICKDANVFVPNTFSPNGDGSNDVFYVRGRGLNRVKSLRIFNRWGEVVFEKRDFAVNDPSVGWDGRYKGAKPHPDVYIYQVEVFCDNGQIIHFEGNVALIQ